MMNRRITPWALAASFAGGLGVLDGGCLSRPIYTAPPNLKTVVTKDVRQTVIDKIDLLFDIDNSASMGDKQQYLQAAIPDLINALINPNCIDASTTMPTGQSTNGMCPAGSQLEFPAVHDMHIGIVSSSLGNRLGDQCISPLPVGMPGQLFGNLDHHNDDQAHLLNRSLTYSLPAMNSATEGVVADAMQGFLYWYPMSNTTPPTQGTPVTVAGSPTMPGTLEGDFSAMVGGTGVFGCGIESQLETWYRFLIQPDPYQSLTTMSTKSGTTATWSGVDTTILQQRHDFLRPDSLVAIVVLSDENDSEIDVRSLSQQGFNWMSTMFPPPRGTAVCGIDGVNGSPNDPSCQSCAALPGGQTGAAAMSDASCKLGPYSATNANDWGYDLNLRHVHTKAKYGLDPQFPIQRYLNGLQNPTVPDRDGEYPGTSAGKITSGGYAGMNDCTNPLFASQLPTGGAMQNPAALCKLPRGTRTKDLVFYAHIGGVPSSLLHFDPNNLKNSTLTTADWVKILGNDPLHYDYSGIDPHMIESFSPRTGLAAPGSANNADPINGHEWLTNTSLTPGGHILNVDREYACTFPLANPDGTPTSRDCTQPQFANFCDCPHTSCSGGTCPLTPQELPPICDQTTQSLQTGAKAYPTIRELLLAKLMGTQGIVSSICPIHVAEMGAGDPLYGYRPAVAVIIDRLKSVLAVQCLPEQLDVVDGQVPCLVLVQLPPQSAGGPGGTCRNPMCDPKQGLVGPGGLIAPGQTFDQAVLDSYCETLETGYQQQMAASGGLAAGADPALQSVCAFHQIVPGADPISDFASTGSCVGSKDPGWCYVTRPGAGGCPQALVFAQEPKSSGISLQCIEQSVSVIGSGASGSMADGGNSGAGD